MNFEDIVFGEKIIGHKKDEVFCFIYAIWGHKLVFFFQIIKRIEEVCLSVNFQNLLNQVLGIKIFFLFRPLMKNPNIWNVILSLGQARAFPTNNKLCDGIQFNQNKIIQLESM
jgi:hypothetical protein